MPRPVCSELPSTMAEATQLASTNTMPTDRSRPPVRTGMVCAMATKASRTLVERSVDDAGRDSAGCAHE